MTDPTDGSTFTEVYAIATSSLANYTYADYLVSFDTVTAPDTAYIAFRYESATDWYFFIDDIVVSLIPNCSAPIQLTASNITATTASLSWVSTADTLMLHYKSPSDALYTETEVVADSTGAFLLTGLLPSTDYTWYLTLNCEGEDYASETATFRTDCAGISAVPETWTFETGNTGGTTSYPLPPCWHRTHGTYPYSYHPTLYNYAHTGTRCLYFNTTSGNLYATIRPIDTFALSFDTL